MCRRKKNRKKTSDEEDEAPIMGDNFEEVINDEVEIPHCITHKPAIPNCDACNIAKRRNVKKLYQRRPQIWIDGLGFASPPA